MLQLKDFQTQAKTAVKQSFDNGKNPLLVMATGTGKTVVAADMIKDYSGEGKKIAFFAHQTHMLRNCAEKLSQHFPDVTYSFEQGYSHYKHQDSLMLGSAMSFNPKRFNRFSKDMFDVVFVDEAHHEQCDTYRRILEFFGNRVIGLTATPERNDNRDLRAIFNHIPYVYSIQRAIKEKNLVPFSIQKIDGVSLDLRGLRTEHGDFVIGDLSTAVEDVIGPLAVEIKKHSSDKRTIVYMPSVRSAEALNDLLVFSGLKSQVIGGRLQSVKERDQLLTDFQDGKFTHLVNVGMVTEGFDVPAVECIVMARPTLSRALYIQMIGRGLRTWTFADGRVKDKCLILEVSTNSDHHEVVTAEEILTFDLYRYTDSFNRTNGEHPLIHWFDTISALGGPDAVRAMLAELTAAQAGTKLYDFNAVANFADIDLGNQSFYLGKALRIDKPASRAQIWFLAKYKINATKMTLNEASNMISVLKAGTNQKLVDELRDNTLGSSIIKEYNKYSRRK